MTKERISSFKNGFSFIRVVAACAILQRTSGAGKLSMPGRPTKLNNSKAGAYCACSRCRGGGGGLWLFLSLPTFFSFLFSLILWETARHRLKCCLKAPLNSRQPTNRSLPSISVLFRSISCNTFSLNGEASYN